MEIATVLAVIAGPILALYMQSWVNLKRESMNRKIGVFKPLMAAKAGRLTLEHVRALNTVCPRKVAASAVGRARPCRRVTKSSRSRWARPS